MNKIEKFSLINMLYILAWFIKSEKTNYEIFAIILFFFFSVWFILSGNVKSE